MILRADADFASLTKRADWDEFFHRDFTRTSASLSPFGTKEPLSFRHVGACFRRETGILGVNVPCPPATIIAIDEGRPGDFLPFSPHPHHRPTREPQ